jgi:hypothetical protein
LSSRVALVRSSGVVGQRRPQQRRLLCTTNCQQQVILTRGERLEFNPGKSRKKILSKSIVLMEVLAEPFDVAKFR